QVPLAFDLTSLVLDLLQRGQRHFELSRLQGLQEYLGHGRIEAIAADGLTGRSALLLMHLVAPVAGCAAVAGLAHIHPSATVTAPDEALQQGVAVAHDTPAVLASEGAVIVQTLLVAQELLPTEVAGVRVVPHNGPVRYRHAADPALAP